MHNIIGFGFGRDEAFFSIMIFWRACGKWAEGAPMMMMMMRVQVQGGWDFVSEHN
jgi:hypothetical protein